MITALGFLRNLKDKPPPPVTLLAGDEEYIRERVRNRIRETWQEPGSDIEIQNLVGIEGAARLPSVLGLSGFFSSRKVIYLFDAPAKKQRKDDPTSFSYMGKKQIATLVGDIKQIPEESVRLVIDPGSSKKDNTFQKTLAAVTVQVDVSPPKGKEREEWIKGLSKKAGAVLDKNLEDRMVASEAPLRTLAADLEKVGLATPEGGQASIDLWQSLTQADPQSTIWEIGDSLGAGNTGGALQAIRNLEAGGLDVYGIVPAVLSWNQQRLQVKSHGQGEDGPPGMHPFVVRKIRAQVGKKTLGQLRQEQRKLFRLDRALKQSWENPHILLEKLLVEFSGRRDK